MHDTLVSSHYPYNHPNPVKPTLESLQQKKEETIQPQIESEVEKESWKGNIEHKWTKLKLKDDTILDIPRHYALGGIVRRMINASDDGFCSVLITGISSSGKTSLVKNILHKIHTTPEYPQFNFKWLHSEDLAKFDKFLKSLEAGLNYVVILDDASFVADGMGVKKNTMGKIGMEINRVRHNLKGGRIIVIVINHALTSVQKSVFRNTTFTIATSLVSNSKKGLIDLMGNQYMINNYGTHYRNQVLTHKVKLPISSYQKSWLELDSKKVRLGLIQEVNWLHYFVWEDNSCEICNQDYYKNESKYPTPLTPSDFIAQLNKVYGINQLSTTVRFWHFIRNGDIMALHPNQRKHWRLINKIAENTNFDFKQVIEKLDERRERKRPDKKWTTQAEKDLEKHIMDKIKND